jgi:2-C-methyl-D-erythritol 2,4-cyclodiphosphate synthase
MRIGCGFDAHRFGAERPLVLGGVVIPGAPGMIAHSDGDVLLHALCDALLGALGLGDIGGMFPDNDQAYAGIDSRILLRRVMERVRENGYAIGNVDATIIAQRPRLAPHIPSMAACLAHDMDTDASRINIKATTTEGMGFTGRGEGIAVNAVVLLTKK